MDLTFLIIHKTSTSPVANAPVPAPALQLRFPSPDLALATVSGLSLIGINKGHSNPIETLFPFLIALAISSAKLSMLDPDFRFPLVMPAQPNLFPLIDPMSAQNAE